MVLLKSAGPIFAFQRKQKNIGCILEDIMGARERELILHSVPKHLFYFFFFISVKHFQVLAGGQGIWVINHDILLPHLSQNYLSICSQLFHSSVQISTINICLSPLIGTLPVHQNFSLLYSKRKVFNSEGLRKTIHTGLFIYSVTLRSLNQLPRDFSITSLFYGTSRMLLMYMNYWMLKDMRANIGSICLFFPPFDQNFNHEILSNTWKIWRNQRVENWIRNGKVSANPF